MYLNTQFHLIWNYKRVMLYCCLPCTPWCCTQGQFYFHFTECMTSCTIIRCLFLWQWNRKQFSSFICKNTAHHSISRYQYLMELHVRHNVPLLLVGDTGTGKTFCVQDMLMCRLSEKEYIPAFVTFNARTTANQTQVCAYMVNVHILDWHWISHAHCVLESQFLLWQYIRSTFNRWGSIWGSYRESWATIFCKVTCFIIDKPNTPP